MQRFTENSREVIGEKIWAVPTLPVQLRSSGNKLDK
jgi:hypothetical protein